MEQLFWSPIKLSISIAITAGCIVLLLGLVTGKWMSRRKFKGKLIIETLFMLPLVLPPSVVGFLLIVIFGRNSFVGTFIEKVTGQPIMFTWWAAVIASTVVAFPLMYQSVKTGFQSVNPDIEDAARTDGADEFRIFLFVSIPLSIKAIVTGGILSFTRALGEFGATLMFAGNIPGKTQTLPTAIYVAIDSGNMELAWLWVLTTIFISFLMLASTYLIK
ncbi:molybdate ABC transporter permease subunit [Fredinandcohnia sp. QZ13]|uniref:molybdate ABC transporter permease subunit n=1 Tax=Fredinandcohnia sp. QZ13 TaxID=3073144 RepID=UPI0028531939|nr:molybdate ABC transporter permease subunit [Fredinandcohnia sp. QZ13]MDR4887055.1 molybdate ABC transporter permease subunit [Fredinandcohnia sp. QZ13]